LWEVEGNAGPDVLPQSHEAAVCFVGVMADRRTILSLGLDRRLIRWDLAGRRKLAEERLAEAVYGAALAGDGRHLAVGNATGPVYVLRLAPP
jgi:hypothetical protein